MCLEIVTKANNNYILRFIPGCKALTDVPSTLTQLIKQRRRWFNGSLFATFHVIGHMFKIFRRRDSFIRNLFLLVLYAYMLLNTFIGYFLVGIFYSAYSIFMRSAYDSSYDQSLHKPANLIENIYLVNLVIIVVFCVSVRIEYVERYFLGLAVVLGGFMIFMIVSMFYYTVSSTINILSFIFIGVIVFSYIIPLVTHFNTLKPVDFLKGVVYSVMLTPTFINIIVVYAICNIHDVSWGSRPSGAQATKVSRREAKMEASYKNYRAWFLLVWLVLNIACGYLVVRIARDDNDDENDENENAVYLLVLSGLLMIVVGAKIIFSLFHIILVKFNNRVLSKKLKSKSGYNFVTPENNQQINISQEYDDTDSVVSLGSITESKSSEKPETISEPSIPQGAAISDNSNSSEISSRSEDDSESISMESSISARNEIDSSELLENKNNENSKTYRQRRFSDSEDEKEKRVTLLEKLTGFKSNSGSPIKPESPKKEKKNKKDKKNEKESIAHRSTDPSPGVAANDSSSSED